MSIKSIITYLQTGMLPSFIPSLGGNASLTLALNASGFVAVEGTAGATAGGFGTGVSGPKVKIQLSGQAQLTPAWDGSYSSTFNNFTLSGSLGLEAVLAPGDIALQKVIKWVGGAEFKGNVDVDWTTSGFSPNAGAAGYAFYTQVSLFDGFAGKYKLNVLNFKWSTNKGIDIKLAGVKIKGGVLGDDQPDSF